MTYLIIIWVCGPVVITDLVLRLVSLRKTRKNSEAAKLGWARRHERENLANLGAEKHRAMWENDKCGSWKE